MGAYTVTSDHRDCKGIVAPFTPTPQKKRSQSIIVDVVRGPKPYTLNPKP